VATRIIGEMKGIALLFETVTRDDPDNGQAWYMLGYSFHALGDHASAVEVHVKAAAFPKVAVNASYNAACAYAVRGKKDEAFAWLRKATDAGFANRKLFQNDKDLASLRGDVRFRSFLPLGAKASFVEELEVLHTLDGEAGGDRFGWIGRNAGDTDGDGVADLLISAPFKALGTSTPARQQSCASSATASRASSSASASNAPATSAATACPTSSPARRAPSGPARPSSTPASRCSSCAVRARATTSVARWPARVARTATAWTT
jgi:hypothetical protein